MDRIRIAVVLRDEAKRGIGIFVNGCLKARLDPLDERRQIKPNFGKQLLVRHRASIVPFFQGDVLRVFTAVNLPLNRNDVIRPN